MGAHSQRGSTHTQITPASTIYTTSEAMVLVHIMSDFNERLSITTTVHGSSFVTKHGLKKGLQLFRDRGKQATIQEMQQVHDRQCFQPIHKDTLSTTERTRALESNMFLVEKREGR
jgi:hypothetical protein